MIPMRAIIADDEPLARESLRSLLDTFSSVEVVDEAEHGLGVIDCLKRTPADVLFLDIRMPLADGFRAVRRSPAAAGMQIVFVTAHSKYATYAFDAGALDYVMKPYSRERLARAIERAAARRRDSERSRLLGHAASLATALGALPINTPALSTLLTLLRERVDDAPSRLRFDRSGDIILLESDDIVSVEAQDNYVEISLTNGDSHLVRATMASVFERLACLGFLRVHRSTIVNTRHVRSMVSMPRGEAALQLVDGRTVRVSRFRRQDVRTQLTALPASH